jgi:hypothetical protein
LIAVLTVANASDYRLSVNIWRHASETLSVANSWWLGEEEVGPGQMSADSTYYFLAWSPTARRVAAGLGVVGRASEVYVFNADASGVNSFSTDGEDGCEQRLVDRFSTEIRVSLAGGFNADGTEVVVASQTKVRWSLTFSFAAHSCWLVACLL